MKYYAVARMNLTDTDWVAGYLEKVTPMVERVGGKYLARTSTVELIEGDGEAPHSVVIIEFPSQTAAEAFYYSEEYQPFKQARQKGSVGEFLFVPGHDIARL